MLTKTEMTLGYDDIGIMSAISTKVEHRSECITRKDGMLPIFTAPMSTVVNDGNAGIFESNGIIPIIPRSVDISLRNEIVRTGRWVAYSLGEFDGFIWANYSVQPGTKILIDLANGHMSKLFKLAKQAKAKFGDNLTLMSGNINNPETYKEYCRAGIDYCRVGIGGGAGCLSSTQLGVHVGIASLISDVYAFKKEVEREIQSVGKSSYKCVTKIIADGGIRNYRHINIALALGADYVMAGSVLCSLVESCAPTFYYNDNGDKVSIDPSKVEIRECDGMFHVKDGLLEYDIDNLNKVFYGMASASGQKDLYGKKIRTVEGKELILDCTTNVDKWVENASDYLASAMSYCDVLDVMDFNPENVDVVALSASERASLNK